MARQEPERPPDAFGDGRIVLPVVVVLAALALAVLVGSIDAASPALDSRLDPAVTEPLPGA